MNGIDIVLVCTLRPEVLKITLDSFKNNLFRDYLGECRVLANIDVVGCLTVDQPSRISEVEELIFDWGAKSVNLRISYDPNFATAWFSRMSEVNEEFVFYLEDDWELLYYNDLDQMLHLLNQYQDLVHLRFSPFRGIDGTMKCWNKFIQYNGSFYEIPPELRTSIGWAGHPGFTRSNFLFECYPYLNQQLNPEKQMKGNRIPNHPMTILMRENRFGVYQNRNSPPSVVDLGRRWMVENKWAKHGSKAFFQTWERVE